MNAALFLPVSQTFVIEEVRLERKRLLAIVRMASGTAKCPVCGVASLRVHSVYRRRLDDLPWFGKPATVLLKTRRFFCDNPDCARRIFAERVPEVALPHSRRTRRLTDATLCDRTGLRGRPRGTLGDAARNRN